jgi:hypothetical protein
MRSAEPGLDRGNVLNLNASCAPDPLSGDGYVSRRPSARRISRLRSGASEAARLVRPSSWSQTSKLSSALERRHDAEVATASTDRPEQVRVASVVDLEALSVRRHDLGGHQAIDGQADLACKDADAAAERESGNTHRGRVPEASYESMRRSRISPIVR